MGWTAQTFTTLRVTNTHGATIMTIDVASGTWILYYDTGTSTQGAIAASGSGRTGTDEFGNAITPTVTCYLTLASGDNVLIAQGPITSLSSFGMTWHNQTHPEFVSPFISGQPSSSIGNAMSLSSGLSSNTAAAAEIDLEDSLASGFANGLMNLTCGRINFKGPAFIIWDSFSGTVPTPNSNQIAFFCDTHERQQIVYPSARAAVVSDAQTENVLRTVTGTTFVQLSAGFNILASDVTTPGHFRLTAQGHGKFGSTTQDLVIAHSLGSGLGIMKIPAANQAASANFTWTGIAYIWWENATTINVNTTLIIGGTQVVGSAASGQTIHNSQTPPVLSSLVALWGSTTGAPTISCDFTSFERLS